MHAHDCWGRPTCLKTLSSGTETSYETKRPFAAPLDASGEVSGPGHTWATGDAHLKACLGRSMGGSASPGILAYWEKCWGNHDIWLLSLTLLLSLCVTLDSSLSGASVSHLFSEGIGKSSASHWESLVELLKATCSCTLCHELAFVPLKHIFMTQPPECELMWKQGHCRCNYNEVTLE